MSGLCTDGCVSAILDKITTIMRQRFVIVSFSFIDIFSVLIKYDDVASWLLLNKTFLRSGKNVMFLLSLFSFD